MSNISGYPGVSTVCPNAQGQILALYYPVQTPTALVRYGRPFASNRVDVLGFVGNIAAAR